MFCMCVIGLGVMAWDGLNTRVGQLSSANQNCGWYDRKQRGLPSIITSVHIIDDIILSQTITHTTSSDYFLFKNLFFFSLSKQVCICILLSELRKTLVWSSLSNDSLAVCLLSKCLFLIFVLSSFPSSTLNNNNITLIPLSSFNHMPKLRTL